MASGKCFVEMMVVSIPFGQMELRFCPSGLHEMHFKDVDFSFLRRTLPTESNTNQFPSAVSVVNQQSAESSLTSVKTACLDYLTAYFGKSSDQLEPGLPPVCWSGIQTTDFSKQVLKTLYQKVPAGAVVSYKGLAELSENAKASRAVGSIMRRNPIALVIPCHRVLRSSPNLTSNQRTSLASEDMCMSDKVVGNYNGGVDIKKWLLLHERSLNLNQAWSKEM